MDFWARRDHHLSVTSIRSHPIFWSMTLSQNGGTYTLYLCKTMGLSSMGNRLLGSDFVPEPAFSPTWILIWKDFQHVGPFFGPAFGRGIRFTARIASVALTVPLKTAPKAPSPRIFVAIVRCRFQRSVLILGCTVCKTTLYTIYICIYINLICIYMYIYVHD